MTEPIISYDIRRCRWILHQGYTYSSGPHHIWIRPGFAFDLASIPRLVWWLIAPFELSICAPLVHDYLYSCGGKFQHDSKVAMWGCRLWYTRAETDALFLRIMCEEGVPRWRRTLAYVAVRLFGWLSWGPPGEIRIAPSPSESFA